MTDYLELIPKPRPGGQSDAFAVAQRAKSEACPPPRAKRVIVGAALAHHLSTLRTLKKNELIFSAYAAACGECPVLRATRHSRG